MKSFRFALLLILTFFLGIVLVSFSPKVALGKPKKNEIPEIDGVYDDPDYPKIKVRVFVHRSKPEKPGKPTPTPAVLQCNLEDPDSSTIVSSAGWKLPASWTYNLNPDSVPSSVGGGNLPKIAKDGFDAWAGATTITFLKGADTTVERQAYDGQNIVVWGRTLGNALGVTYIRYYSDTGEVVDVDTIMNKKFSWMWYDLSTSCAWQDFYDAENILTHELGHWVGLDDEYDVSLYQNATMYGYGSKTEVKKTTLTTGDIQGASQIYW